MDKRAVFRSASLPWLLLAPQLTIIVVFFFWPAAQALLQSVQQQDAFGSSVTYVGGANFAALARDPTYLASCRITAEFAGLVTVTGLALALILAVMADRVVRGASFYRTLLILPYAFAPVISGLLWTLMFDNTVGVATWALAQAGVAWNHLLDSRQAMALIVMAAVWKQISYNFLFFLAGLQAVPKSLIEAAAIDGAGPWQRFLTIQWPLLSPTSFFLLVINLVYALFDTFAIVDATTQGGPGKATSTLVYRVYVDGFRALDYGGSAAQSVVLMVIAVTLTIIQFRVVEPRVSY